MLNLRKQKRVKIVCVKEFDDNFKKLWSPNFEPETFKPGWETWVSAYEWFECEGWLVLPESNKYCINFHKKNFELKHPIRVMLDRMFIDLLKLLFNNNKIKLA